MPNFDGTGPMGQGPMTGRGMGYCVVPVGRSTSAPGPFAAVAMPHYSAIAPPVRVGTYGFPGMAYPRFGPGPWFAYTRDFGRRGGRGRRW
jgi:hypothetical protein